MTEYQPCVMYTPCGLIYAKDYVDKKKPYRALSDYLYYSERYDKYVRIRYNDRSDGATGALDIPSCGWWVHDNLCENGCWEDGTPITNWQCSMVLRDILWSEGRWFRSNRWFVATFLLGGGKARDNGMFTLRAA